MSKKKSTPVIGRSLTDAEVAELGVDQDLRPESAAGSTNNSSDPAENYTVAATVASATSPAPADASDDSDDLPVVDSDDVELNDLIAGVTSTGSLVERIITVGKKRVAYHIKRLSPRERNALEGRKYRRTASGTVEQLDPGILDTIMLGWTLHECVRRKDGSPRWTIEEILGQPERRDRKQKVIAERIVGLVERGEEEVDQLLYDLRRAVYDVNPRLDPTEALRALGLIGERYLDESIDG